MLMFERRYDGQIKLVQFKKLNAKTYEDFWGTRCPIPGRWEHSLSDLLRRAKDWPCVHQRERASAYKAKVAAREQYMKACQLGDDFEDLREQAKREAKRQFHRHDRAHRSSHEGALRELACMETSFADAAKLDGMLRYG